MSFVLYLPLACRDFLSDLLGFSWLFSFFLFDHCMRCVIVIFIFVVRSRTAALLYTQAGLLFFSEKFLAYLVHLHKHCLMALSNTYNVSHISTNFRPNCCLSVLALCRPRTVHRRDRAVILVPIDNFLGDPTIDGVKGVLDAIHVVRVRLPKL